MILKSILYICTIQIFHQAIHSTELPLHVIMSNWSELPQDLLLILLEKLDNLFDYIRFCSVCSSWRSVGKTDSHRIRRQPPCLLFSSGKFLPITQLQNPHPPKSPLLSLPQNTACLGSYRGWLAILNRDVTMLHLQNPVSGQQIALPPLKAIIDNHKSNYQHRTSVWPIKKAVLSSEPSSSSCFVVVICSISDLFYCKLGDATWTRLLVPGFAESRGFSDVTYHMGQLLALQSTGTIFTTDLNSSCPRLTKLDTVGYTWNHAYLVSCGAELLVVSHREACNGVTKFEVQKQDYITTQWRDVKDIGGYALFLGYNRSFAVLATGLKGIQANHIYFTHVKSYKTDWQYQCLPAEHEVGMYDLEQSKVKPICQNNISIAAENTSVWWVPKIQ